MNRVQRIAWFNIVVLALCIVVSCFTVAWLASRKGFPFALHGFGMLGLCVLHLPGPLLFRQKRPGGRVAFDERDAQIAQRASSCRDTVSVAVLLLFFLCAWLLLGLRGSVPVVALGVLLAAAYVLSTLAESATTLILYARGIADAE